MVATLNFTVDATRWYPVSADGVTPLPGPWLLQPQSAPIMFAVSDVEPSLSVIGATSYFPNAQDVMHTSNIWVRTASGSTLVVAIPIQISADPAPVTDPNTRVTDDGEIRVTDDGEIRVIQ